MIGFLFGIAVAFLVAPLTFSMEAISRAVGTPLTFEQIVYGLVALYGLAVLSVAGGTFRASTQGDAATLRLSALTTFVLAALALIAWLSSRALMRA